MSRKYIHIRTNKECKQHLYVDEEVADIILKHVEQSDKYSKKFRYITEVLLMKQANNHMYSSEKISESTKEVTAIKIIFGTVNDRIYCKEYQGSGGEKHIVMAALYKGKKSKDVDKKIIPIIEKVGGYHYDF